MYDATRQMIVSIAQARGGFGGLRSWFGALDDLRGETTATDIARHLGARLSDTFDDGSLVSLTDQEAARALSFVASNSMAYPRSIQPNPELIEQIYAGLAALGTDARFYSNGEWHRSDSLISWKPLTEATFDTGVIGLNPSVGFMIWAEEED